MRDAYRWYGVEAKLVAAIRQAAPANTIIAAGAKWDDDDDMILLEPLRDPNVIYVFHFYEPHIFTHQGATWGAYYWHWLKGLHYPSSPENAAKVRPRCLTPCIGSMSFAMDKIIGTPRASRPKSIRPRIGHSTTECR